MSMSPSDLTPGRKVWVWRPHHRVAVLLIVTQVFTIPGRTKLYVGFDDGLSLEIEYCFATRQDLVAAIVPELEEDIAEYQERIDERRQAIAELWAGTMVAAGV